MTVFRIITSREMAANAVENWRKAYEHWEPDRKFADGKTKKQNDDAFNSTKHTPNNIAKIMGNKSWTHPKCDFCNENFDECLQMKEEWDEDQTTMCKGCIEKAHLIISGGK